MATLLQGVNEVLKRVSIIAGDVGELASLVDSPRQVFIDTAVQAWNEVIDRLYSQTGQPLPKVLKETTITLADGVRNYALPADLTRVYFPLIDETNGFTIEEYPGGYLGLVADQPIPSQRVGRPLHAVVRPTDMNLYMDATPTSEEAGSVYTLRYDGDVSLSSASDTFPFSDAVFRALVPAVAEIWRRNRNKAFSESILVQSLGTASQFLSAQPQRSSWIAFGGRGRGFDPFEH